MLRNGFGAFASRNVRDAARLTRYIAAAAGPAQAHRGPRDVRRPRPVRADHVATSVRVCCVCACVPLSGPVVVCNSFARSSTGWRRGRQPDPLAPMPPGHTRRPTSGPAILTWNCARPVEERAASTGASWRRTQRAIRRDATGRPRRYAVDATAKDKIGPSRRKSS